MAFVGYRVNYTATYKAVQNHELPAGGLGVGLEKVTDQSTFANMPKHLEFNVLQSSATLSGLTVLAAPAGPITFNSSDCAQ